MCYPCHLGQSTITITNSAKMGIGLHNDIVLEDFAVEEHLKVQMVKFLKLSNRFGSNGFINQKIFQLYVLKWMQFSHTGNLVLLRVGLEYGYHISKD
jgi:hypothetical protein